MQTMIFLGEQQSFTCPSGRKVTIREANGQDEGYLSSAEGAMQSVGINTYLSSIIVGVKDDSGEYSHVDPEVVYAWPVRDRIYILFKSRLLTHGTMLEFKHTCNDKECGKVSPFEEDLTKYDDDLSKPRNNQPLIPKPGAPAGSTMPNPDYEPYRITPYKLGNRMLDEKELASGQRVRIHILTGIMEKFALESTSADANKNFPLRIHNFQVLNRDNGEWEDEFTFAQFSGKQMTQLRKWVDEVDGGWEPISEVTCPYCKGVEYIPLTRNPDFFFPAGT